MAATHDGDDLGDLGAPATGDAIYTYWREFDLDGYRATLDETGLKVADNQGASLENKRALAEKTKEFKRTTSAEVFKAVSSLIRAYQEEVDRLSTRAKYAETSFLDVYQRLYEAPDPVPALATALDMAARAADTEAQLVRVTTELAEYKAESASLQNQTHTVRALQDKVKVLEATVQEKERQLEHASHNAAAQEASRALEEAIEQKARLEQRLEEAVNSLTTVKEQHESSQNQLFTMQAEAEQQQAALMHELEVVTVDVEQAQERIRVLEQENAMLLANNQHAPTTTTRSSLLAHDASLVQQLAAAREAEARHQEQLAAVHTALEHARADADHCVAAIQADMVELETTIAVLTEENHALTKQLEAQQPDAAHVKELQQQVTMLQALAGYTVDGGLGHGDAAAGGASSHHDGQRGGDAVNGETNHHARGHASGATTLEAMLLEKNRHLEHELTVARVAAADATEALESMRARVTDMETSLEHHQRLVARLEDDLLAAGVETTNGGGGGQRHNSGGQHNGGVHGGAVSGDAQGEGGESSAAAGTEGGNGNGEGGAHHALVKVLSSQRDRLRQRCQQLEEEAQALGNALAKAKKDLEASKADNIALVERLRYVQGYTGGKEREDVEVGGDVVGRYSGQYETSVDPFNRFRVREREQRKKQMGIADRAMFLFGQLINSSKLARTMVFVYTLMLHALVFFMMMHTAHKTPAQSLKMCGEYCMRLQQQQMQVAGSGGDVGGGVVGGTGGNGTTRGLLADGVAIWL